MFHQVARQDFEFLQPLLNALRSKQPHRIEKFEDVEIYDIDEIIQRQQQLIPQGMAAQVGKRGVSLVERAAAMLRSVLGLSETDARRFVESVVTPEHKSQSKLTQDALAAWYRTLEVSGEPPNADAA